MVNLKVKPVTRLHAPSHSDNRVKCTFWHWVCVKETGFSVWQKLGSQQEGVSAHGDDSGPHCCISVGERHGGRRSRMIWGVWSWDGIA